MKGKPWTVADDLKLFEVMMQALGEGERVMGYHSPTAKQIAKELGRSLSAVQTRFTALRVASRFML